MRRNRRFQKISNRMLAEITGQHANAQPPIWIGRIGKDRRGRAGKARGIGTMRRRNLFRGDARHVIQPQQQVLPGGTAKWVFCNGPALHRHGRANITSLLQGQPMIHLGISTIRHRRRHARQMRNGRAGLPKSHERCAQFAPHQRIARCCFKQRLQMENGAIWPPCIAPKPGNGAMQILSGAGSQRARDHLSRRIGACGQKQRHQIGGSAHIGRALAERFTKGRFRRRPVTGKSQGLP